jgi:hypothetical protein
MPRRVLVGGFVDHRRIHRVEMRTLFLLNDLNAPLCVSNVQPLRVCALESLRALPAIGRAHKRVKRETFSVSQSHVFVNFRRGKQRES